MIVSTKERLSWGHSLAFSLILLSALVTPPAHPQGCAQCREAVGQTPARTQQAYRRGIEIMVLAAATIFTASVLVIRRYR